MLLPQLWTAAQPVKCFIQAPDTPFLSKIRRGQHVDVLRQRGVQKRRLHVADEHLPTSLRGRV